MKFQSILFPLLIQVALATTNQILHLTDLHFDVDYLEGSWATCVKDEITYPCCNYYDLPTSPYLKAGPYGYFWCDSSYRLINETLNWITSQPNIKPDYVFWTGDSANHHIIDQSKTKNLAAIKNMTELILSYFPNTTVLPSLGNHDTWPVDQMSAHQSWLINPVAQYWKQWLQNEYQDFRIGGFWRVNLTPTLKLISLSTTYFDKFNLESRDPDPLSQWDWLTKELASSNSTGQKVWIIGHIYPGNVEAREDFSQTYQNITSQYHQIIQGHFFGHLHQDQFSLIRDPNTDEATGVLYIAPSITAYSIVNPSFRLYDYDPITYEILDHHNYHLELMQANQLGQLIYQPTYSAKSYFNLTNLSPGSWDKLAIKLTSNPSLLRQYRTLVYYANVSETYTSTCDSSCQQELSCEIMHSVPSKIKECTEKSRNT